MVMSVQREFFFRGARMNLRDVERVRLMAREAAAGWVAVESALAELGNEVEKTKRSTIRGVTQ
jgi:hypothetical protein